MHELKAICVVFFPFFSFLGVTLATDSAVHAYEKSEQESKKAQNTLWGKEYTVNHLKVI